MLIVMKLGNNFCLQSPGSMQEHQRPNQEGVQEAWSSISTVCHLQVCKQVIQVMTNLLEMIFISVTLLNQLQV